jgi:glycosyltransferase involved in cell wall biosynthesis
VSARPKLLFVSPRFLFPLDEGGKIRTAGVLRAMKGGAFEIVLASPASSDPAAFTSHLESVCDRFVHWPEYRPGFWGRTLAFCGKYPISAASEHSAEGRRIVATEMDHNADLVVIDYPHAALLAPERPGLPAVVFTHNVEAEILERHATLTTGIKRLIWRREATKMKRLEQIALRRCNRAVAVSPRDARMLKGRYGLGAIDVIDTGVDLEFYGFDAPERAGRTVVFCGAMDSRSNIDGISFLMDEVWPLLVAIEPEASMLVVGRNPPASLVTKAASRGLAWHFTGFVDDVRPHILAGDVAVIPLRVGSGTRLKAFESMALGRPIVSTKVGVEGLSVEPAEHYLVAESAPEFAAAISSLLHSMAERRRIALNARKLLEQHFSWSRIGRQFEAICLKTLDVHGASDRRGHITSLVP